MIDFRYAVKLFLRYERNSRAESSEPKGNQLVRGIAAEHANWAKSADPGRSAP
jgi:hypothetical protein